MPVLSFGRRGNARGHRFIDSSSVQPWRGHLQFHSERNATVQFTPGPRTGNPCPAAFETLCGEARGIVTGKQKKTHCQHPTTTPITPAPSRIVAPAIHRGPPSACTAKFPATVVWFRARALIGANQIVKLRHEATSRHGNSPPSNFERKPAGTPTTTQPNPLS